MVSKTPKENYNRSELEYEVIKESSDHSLVKINLITGRFHQIRAQLAAEGYPVVGDLKYLPALPDRQAGGRQAERFNDGSIALSATEIKFKTSTTGEIINLKIDYPAEWSDLIS